MSEGSAKRFIIVGGGTAGWLAALILREGARRSGMNLDITVIESSKLPPIGVGEGSTAVLRILLQQLGLDEAEFLRATGATIKYGIRHRDWRRVGHDYLGPIDDPQQVASGPAGNWLDRYCIASGRSVTEPHLFTYLMSDGKAPVAIREGKPPLPIGPFHHAFHFDQALVGKWLRDKAKGVAQLDAKVKGAEVVDGRITALALEGGGRVEGDFFIDCTGFRRALIVGALGASWVGYGDQLPVNRAMPFWLEHPPGAEIPTYTHAWAQTSGWMWQIPTQERMGCGYVYSDAHLTPDQAQAEIETVLGHPIEPRNDIAINAGRLDRAWVGNCLAVGLAQSFFEPLEATSIHGTIVQLMLFTQTYLAKAAQGVVGPEPYNRVIARQGDDFATFINAHYAGERRDSPFWRDVADQCIAYKTKARLETWRSKTPDRADFTPFPGGLPHVEEQLYVPVLDGLGLLNRQAAKAELGANPKLRAHARKTAEALTRDNRRAASRATGHRAYLEGL